MKKVCFIIILSLLALTSCQQKEVDTNENVANDTVAVVTDEAIDELKSNGKVYCCETHPEFQGKSKDKCPKCGMELTKPAEDTAVDSE